MSEWLSEYWEVMNWWWICYVLEQKAVNTYLTAWSKSRNTAREIHEFGDDPL